MEVEYASPLSYRGADGVVLGEILLDEESSNPQEWKVGEDKPAVFNKVVRRGFNSFASSLREK